MKSIGLCVLFSVAILPSAHSQVKPGTARFEAGTVIFLGVSKEKVVMAADSRTIVGQDIHGKKTYRDNQCKLAALDNKVLYGASGLVADSSKILPFSFNAMATARDGMAKFPLWLKHDEEMKSICKLPDCDPAKLPPRKDAFTYLIDYWRANVSGELQAFSINDMAQWKEVTGKDMVEIYGIFVGVDPPNPFEIRIIREACTKSVALEPKACTPDETIATITPTDDMKWYVYGITDIGYQLIDSGNQHIVIPHSDCPAWKVAEQLVGLTIALSKDKEWIHEPIDVVEIGSDGKIVWRRNPQNCREN